MNSRLILIGAVLVAAAAYVFLRPASGVLDQDVELPKAGMLAGSRNVVLITVDTLRIDHMSCYGYYRETTPNIDELARQSIVFERATSTMGTTLPAHLSLMTGLWPHQHGYVANVGAIPYPFLPTKGRRAVAQAFQDAGYQTAAFVSGTTVKKRTGMNAGFDVFDEPDFDKGEGKNRLGRVTNAKALKWLENAGDQPFFLWVHYWDPHEPNRPPAPYDTMYQTDDTLRAMVEERRVNPDRLQEKFGIFDRARMFAPELQDDAKLFELGRLLEEPPIPPVDLELIYELINLYDGDVRYTDDCVGELIDAMKKHGLWDESIFVLTSDHGQALGQHDWLEHGPINGENTNVPLIVRLPDGLLPPQRIDAVVSHVDVVPTILGRLDHPALAKFLSQPVGRDLFSGRFDRSFAFAHRTEREREWEKGSKYGIRVGKWRYYRVPEESDQLFDLDSDPGELVNVIDQHPEVAEELRAAVNQILSERGFDPSTTQEVLNDEAGEALSKDMEAVGYAGVGGNALLEKFDVNGNGKLDPEERAKIEQLYDTDKNGKIDPAELERMQADLSSGQ